MLYCNNYFKFVGNIYRQNPTYGLPDAHMLKKRSDQHAEDFGIAE